MHIRVGSEEIYLSDLEDSRADPGWNRGCGFFWLGRLSSGRGTKGRRRNTHQSEAGGDPIP